MNHKHAIEQAFDELGAAEVLGILAGRINESLAKFNLEQFEADRARLSYLKDFDRYLKQGE